MNTLSYKTPNANKVTAHKGWVVVDATDQSLGRLASKVAKLLRGKHKSDFTPHVDCGDNVVLINAKKMLLTGKKMQDKAYLSYSGYPGGQKSINPARLIEKPNGYDKIIRHAVKGMLPKNRLARHLMANLYIYEGSEHKQEAQKPDPIDLNLFK